MRHSVVTPADLLDEAERRADAAGAINAVVRRRTPEQGAGPFGGVPYLVKDLGPALAGVPLTQGSGQYADDVPTHDDAFVARLKAAGLAIFGKTNTPGLGQFPEQVPIDLLQALVRGLLPRRWRPHTSGFLPGINFAGGWLNFAGGWLVVEAMRAVAGRSLRDVVLAARRCPG